MTFLNLDNSTVSLLGTLGLLFVALKLWAVLQWLWIHFVCRNDLRCYGAHCGGWALVTGASAGIGEAFAWELARRGMNVVIVARSTQTLELLAKQLRAQCGVQVLVVPADAAKGEDAVAGILKQLESESVSVSLLVNNVGVEAGDPSPLLGKKTPDIDSMIAINVRFSTLLTAQCLPQLQLPREGQNGDGHRSGVVNVSSTAANATPPLLAVYSGTKAYNRAFSTALSSELRLHRPTPSSPVDVLSARASFVETKMSGLKAGGLKGCLMQVILPRSFVSSCLDKLSYVDDISPHWAHDLQTLFMGSLPRSLAERFLYSRVGARYRDNLHRSEERAAGVAKKTE